MEMDLRIKVKTVEGIPIIDLIGEVDAYTCADFRDKMLEVIENINPNIVINMSEVEYIDSSGLGTLVGGLKRSSEKDGKITLICNREQICKVFQITGLERVFPIFITEEQAVGFFTNRSSD